MPTPRPHYKERIAHAEGYDIETLVGDQWVLVTTPCFATEMQYRVKPEPKPDVVRNVWIKKWTSGYVQVLEESETHNLRLTFDGETGKLKSAEVI